MTLSDLDDNFGCSMFFVRLCVLVFWPSALLQSSKMKLLRGDNMRGSDIFVRIQPCPRPKGWGFSVPIIFGPPTYVHTVWPTATKFGRITHVGRGVFLMCLSRPHPKRRGPWIHQIFPPNFSDSTYAHTVWAKRDKIRYGNVWGEACFKGSGMVSIPKEWGSSTPNFGTFYIHPHRMTRQSNVAWWSTLM